MLERHEIEIYKLSGWPDFPVSFHNVKIACLQILFNILEDEMHYCNFLYFPCLTPAETVLEGLMPLSQRQREMLGRKVPGPTPPWPELPSSRGTWLFSRGRDTRSGHRDRPGSFPGWRTCRPGWARSRIPFSRRRPSRKYLLYFRKYSLYFREYF